jgi:hypothetical protein
MMFRYWCGGQHEQVTSPAERLAAPGPSIVGPELVRRMNRRQIMIEKQHDRADRWGIFAGHRAPTFLGLGNVLRTYEK